MNYEMILSIDGKVLAVEAMFMLPALIISGLEQDWGAVVGFAVAIAAALVPGVPALLRKPRRSDIYARDGLVAVGLAWLSPSFSAAPCPTSSTPSSRPPPASPPPGPRY